MFEISVEHHFDAAHYLRGYRGGKCESLHGHRFQVVVGVRGEFLDEVGLVYDFTELKAHLREILAPFDHTCLNDLPPFKEKNPSSENIALTVYEELEPRLSGVGVAYVEVWESPESRVRFTP